MKVRTRKTETPDGLAERRRLKLAGVMDDDLLEAVRPLRHPSYRRHTRATSAEHRASVASAPNPQT